MNWHKPKHVLKENNSTVLISCKEQLQTINTDCLSPVHGSLVFSQEKFNYWYVGMAAMGKPLCKRTSCKEHGWLAPSHSLSSGIIYAIKVCWNWGTSAQCWASRVSSHCCPDVLRSSCNQALFLPNVPSFLSKNFSVIWYSNKLLLFSLPFYLHRLCPQ